MEQEDKLKNKYRYITYWNIFNHELEINNADNSLSNNLDSQLP